jgi:hypothetical protein
VWLAVLDFRETSDEPEAGVNFENADDPGNGHLKITEEIPAASTSVNTGASAALRGFGIQRKSTSGNTAESGEQLPEENKNPEQDSQAKVWPA